MEHDKLRFVSVDPGTNLGVAILDYDTVTHKVIVKDAYTLDLTRLVSSDDHEDKQRMVLLRLSRLKAFLNNYLKRWKPQFAAHETAYVPHRGGGASIASFASLIENILRIRFFFFDKDHDMQVFTINPSAVKFCIAGEKSSDKKLILNALLKDDTVDLSELKSTALDQHSADAVGIGITCIRQNFQFNGSNFKIRVKKNGGKK